MVEYARRDVVEHCSIICSQNLDVSGHGVVLVFRLARIARRSGRSRSEVVRDAVRRHVALAEFADLRRRIMPPAEAQGYLTDEDVFRDVS